MPYYFFHWTEEIIRHLAENGVTQEDFEKVVGECGDRAVSRSSGSPAAFGYTEDGRHIIAVFDLVDDLLIVPKTAYEVPEPREGAG